MCYQQGRMAHTSLDRKSAQITIAASGKPNLLRNHLENNRFKSYVFHIVSETTSVCVH